MFLVSALLLCVQTNGVEVIETFGLARAQLESEELQTFEKRDAVVQQVEKQDAIVHEENQTDLYDKYGQADPDLFPSQEEAEVEKVFSSYTKS